MAFNELHPHVECRHEPLDARYACKHMHLHPEVALPFLVGKHFEYIGNLKKTYIETGWPCFTAMRAAEIMFGEDFRVIHLRRNEVDTAQSMEKMHYYRVLDSYKIFCLLDPTTDRYATEPPEWSGASSLMKCMWLCQEMTAHHTQFIHQAGARGMTIDYDDLFYGDAFNDVCEWLGLERKDTTELRKRKVDDYAVV
jgi:hypothetical protein